MWDEEGDCVRRDILLKMRRIDRFWKILTSRSFTPLGKLDLLRVLSARRERKKVLYPIRLPVGENLVDGENAAVDFQVLGQVFLDEVYGELQFRDRIVIDVGAHKGYFAAYALMSGAKAILSYEPERMNFTCLARFAESARLHGMAIQIFHVAVSDSDGEVTLYLSHESWRHTTVLRQGDPPGQTLRVRSCSLARILERVATTFIGQELILKIDAEGVEGQLLLNTPSDCFAPVKEIVFEYHSFAGCELRIILERLQSLGFEYRASVKDSDLHHLCAYSHTSTNPVS
jgi:FkbM family methyltransferase